MINYLNFKKFSTSFHLQNIYSFRKLIICKKTKQDFKENNEFFKHDKLHRNNCYNKNSNKFNLKLLLFIALFFSPLANTSLSDKCLGLFKTKNTVYSLNKNTTLTNSYSQKLYKYVYQQLPTLEGEALSHKETQQYILQLEQLIQLLEKNLNQSNKRLQLLDSYLTPALKKLPNIISFIKSESALKHESLDTQTVLRLTLSTFSKHLHTYLTHSKTKSLDWSRLRVILESIASFNKQQPAFSLYKIYRSVREKYSIKEYINCK